MKPISLRTGFATNSSSSHSIIYSADPSRFPDDREHGHNDFGWEWFLQKTRKEKLRYIVQCLEGWEIEDIARHLDVDVEEVSSVHSKDGYIDHDSVGLIPQKLMKTILNSDKYAILGGNDNSDPPEWASVFDEVDTSMIGSVTEAYQTMMNNGLKRYVNVDRDTVFVTEPQAVTTFNRRTGEKIRYNPTGESSEVYLTVPELVDIKITDYCPYGCEYCYQDSTVDGVHANTDEIFAMIDFMKDQGVFELAIGGGEPTLHPDFDAIIDHCVRKNDDGVFIVPNFTTRNLSVFRGEPEYVCDLLQKIGGFAYSVDTIEDVDRFKKLMDYWFDDFDRPFKEVLVNPKHGYDTQCKSVKTRIDIITALFGKVSFQVVLGSMEREDYNNLVTEVDNLIEHCVERLHETATSWTNVRSAINAYAERNGLRRVYIMGVSPYHFPDEDGVPSIMLLGYKTTGRGSEPEYDYSLNGIKDMLDSSRRFNVGIDTAAAQQMKEQLDELGVPPESYYTKEGVASCYVDAVTGKMAASSYNNAVATDTMDEYTESSFIDTFNVYQKSALNAIAIEMV